MLKDPSLASPDPARAKHIPKDEAEFLAAYESRLKEIVEFLRANRLVTIPEYMGPLQIRQLSEAFKPTNKKGPHVHRDRDQPTGSRSEEHTSEPSHSP